MLNNPEDSIATMLVIIYLQIAVDVQYACILVTYLCTTHLATIFQQLSSSNLQLPTNFPQAPY
jgi:hypothetical protein